ncbi:hypothetical protein GCM10011578_027690 [Streptomyces fuscichromogenes]|uniref:Uncharacterized protein n=1 Tax=Streptomyces fuscichromogenes TaxID=1324013 RepID=A0A917XC22_9ACTN|nr:hypothetical protein GCM10011578_027690 [Streptomyces fuscichromogenes]
MTKGATTIVEHHEKNHEIFGGRGRLWAAAGRWGLLAQFPAPPRRFLGGAGNCATSHDSPAAAHNPRHPYPDPQPRIKCAAPATNPAPPPPPHNLSHRHPL